MLKKVLWGVAIAALLVIVLMLTGVISGDINTTAASVKAVTTKEGRITKDIFANGKIESKLIREHFAPTAGQVGKITIKKGDLVTKGKELLALATTNLESELRQERHQLQVNQAEKEKFLKDEEKERTKNFETLKKEMSESGNSGSLNAVLDPSEADLKIYDLKIRQAQTRIDEFEKKLENSRIIAEIDGIVTQISVKEGQEITQGSPAFVLTNVAQIQARASFAENDANLAKVGMPVTVTGDAFAGSYKGNISYISPVAVTSELDAKESIVEFTVDLAESAEELRPGYKASVKLTVEGNSRILIPVNSIKRDGQRSYVYKIVDQKAVRQYVKIGEENDDFIEILEGLQPNEQLIEGPSLDIKDGLQVQIK